MLELYYAIKYMRHDQRLELSSDKHGSVRLTVVWLAGTTQERRETVWIHRDEIAAEGDKAIVRWAKNLLRMH